MSTVEVPASWAFDATLSPTEYRMLCCLLAKGPGPVVADRATLARWANVSQVTVSRAVVNLEARGWLRVVRRPAEPCTYSLLAGVAA